MLRLHDATVYESAARRHRDAIDDQRALQLPAESMAGTVLPRINGVVHANDEARPGRHGCIRAGGFLGSHRLGGRNTRGQEQSDDFAFREGFDALAGVEHDDAVARANEITLEKRAVGQFHPRKAVLPRRRARPARDIQAQG